MTELSFWTLFETWGLAAFVVVASYIQFMIVCVLLSREKCVYGMWILNAHYWLLYGPCVLCIIAISNVIQSPVCPPLSDK